jgi:ATP-dependent helicase/nuclease subunit B
MAGLRYIPHAHAAVSDFAEWFTQHIEPTYHSQVHVLVPNRRLARAMVECFGERQLLPPKMLSLGSLTHTECLRIVSGQTDIRRNILAIPRALDASIMRHHMIRCVMHYQQKKYAHARMESASELADALLRILEHCDEAGTELTPERLRMLAPSYFARHWRHASEFLAIIGAFIPALLDDHKAVTHATQQRLFMKEIAGAAARLTAPLILFGSSGSVPYIRDCMQKIAQASHGYVFLSGTADTQTEEGEAYYFTDQSTKAIAMAPDATPPIRQASSSAIHALLCQNEEEEARVVTVLMRDSIANGQKQTMLITRDIPLMRRVACLLAQDGIIADSPSIRRLDQSPLGQWLLAACGVLAAPHALCALRVFLAHPWVGEEDSHYSAWCQHADMHSLRGVASYRPTMEAPLSEVGAALEHWLMHDAHALPMRAAIGVWGAQLRTLARLSGLHSDNEVALLQWLDMLDTLDGIYDAVSIHDFAAFVTGQLRNNLASGARPTHPHLRMLTPVEARLMHADRVIFGAFHHACWGQGEGDGWLNDAQLRALSLPARSAMQSLTLHDIAMHSSAPEVFFTRATMVDHSPSKPYMAAHHYIDRWQSQSQWHQWAQATRLEAYAPIVAPAPTPTREQRPSRVAVRALDVAQRNPYQFYVEYILALQQLDAYGPKPDAMLFGVLAHRVMEMLAQNTVWNERTRDTLLRHVGCDGAALPFWQARLDRIAAFAVGWLDTFNEAGIDPEKAIAQELTLDNGHTLTLAGRVDAIIQHSTDGGYLIVDYKTGTIPTAKNVESGESCQLTAYGMLLQQQCGAWPDSICFLRLPDVKNDASDTTLRWGSEQWQRHRGGIRTLLTDICCPATPFVAQPRGIKASEARSVDGISRTLEVQMNGA